jgi:SAM-dependent methyltransferase
MYLNGVDTALAFDIRSADRQRSAEALYDLLAECALRPDHWHKSEVTREDFFERLYSFDYEALKAGDPAGGIASTGLTYLIGDIHEAPMKCDSFDLVSSRATLEHFLEFDRAMDELYRIMTPGAVSFHSIDLADHRVYRDPTSFNRWSFLTDESWIDPLCNRLRASEIIKTAESSGFKVDVIGVERISLPQQIRAQLDGRFGRMGNEDLETVSLECVFRKGVNL